jgi:hypothetical protein
MAPKSPFKKKRQQTEGFIQSYPKNQRFLSIEDDMAVLMSGGQRTEKVNKDKLPVGEFSPHMLAREFAKAKEENRMPSLQAIAQMSNLMDEFLKDPGKIPFEEVAYSGKLRFVRTFANEQRFWRNKDLAFDVEGERIIKGLQKIEDAIKLVAKEKKLSESTVKNAYRFAKKYYNCLYDERIFSRSFPLQALFWVEKAIKTGNISKKSRTNVQGNIQKYKKFKDVKLYII